MKASGFKPKAPPKPKPPSHPPAVIIRANAVKTFIDLRKVLLNYYHTLSTLYCLTIKEKKLAMSPPSCTTTNNNKQDAQVVNTEEDVGGVEEVKGDDQGAYIHV